MSKSLPKVRAIAVAARYGEAGEDRYGRSVRLDNVGSKRLSLGVTTSMASIGNDSAIDDEQARGDRPSIDACKDACTACYGPTSFMS